MRVLARVMAVVVLAMPAVPRTARAIPAFARKYRVSCSQCHSPVPRLNAFGEMFAANGFEFAVGEPPRDTIGTTDPLLRLQNDLPLARGHYGAGYQLGLTALRRAQMPSPLLYSQPANRAFYEAGRGLAWSLAKLGKQDLAREVVAQLVALDPSDPLKLRAMLDRVEGERT